MSTVLFASALTVEMLVFPAGLSADSDAAATLPLLPVAIAEQYQNQHQCLQVLCYSPPRYYGRAVYYTAVRPTKPGRSTALYTYQSIVREWTRADHSLQSIAAHHKLCTRVPHRHAAWRSAKLTEEWAGTLPDLPESLAVFVHQQCTGSLVLTTSTVVIQK
eukprot:COSAG02_NODE_8185_length_2670_cov_2.654998_3_plen_161_part_00